MPLETLRSTRDTCRLDFSRFTGLLLLARSIRFGLVLSRAIERCCGRVLSMCWRLTCRLGKRCISSPRLANRFGAFTGATLFALSRLNCFNVLFLCGFSLLTWDWFRFNACSIDGLRFIVPCLLDRCFARATPAFSKREGALCRTGFE